MSLLSANDKRSHTKGVRPMEQEIDGILISVMVGVAFLANYTYLMS
jgi:hypothetical protein